VLASEAGQVAAQGLDFQVFAGQWGGRYQGLHVLRDSSWPKNSQQMKELLQPRLRYIVDLMRTGQLHMPSLSAVTPVVPRGGDHVICPLQWGDVAAKGVRSFESSRLGNLLHDQSYQNDTTGNQPCQRNPLALLLQGDSYFNVAHAVYLFGYVDLVNEALPWPATRGRDNWLSILLQAISGGESDGDTWLGLRGACHCPPLPATSPPLPATSPPLP